MFDTRTITTNGGSRGNTELLQRAKELMAATLDAGGLDAIIDEYGGTGFWDDQTAEDAGVHFEDSRKASSLANRINDGKVSGLLELAGDAGYFEATSVSDDTEHGVLVPDYSSDEWKAYEGSGNAFVAEHGEDSDLVRALKGAHLKLRFVDADSERYDEEHAAELAKAAESSSTDEEAEEAADEDE